MKKHVHKLLCYIFVLLCLKGSAQDIHLSQFYEAPLLRNPALAGLFSGDLRLQAVHRTQWESVTVPYKTTSINGEVKLPVGKSQDFITVGGQIFNDQAGTIALTSTQVQPVINYHKSLSTENNRYLSLGFMGGLSQRRFDRSKVTTNSQFDGTGYNGSLSNGENFSQTSYTNFDGTVGLSFNTQLGTDQANNLFVGVAYHHFNSSQKTSFYNASGITVMPKWVMSAGAKMATTDFTYLTIHADYSKQGPYTELIGGAMISYQLDDVENPRYFVHAGGFIRYKDALIPMAKLEVKPIAFSVSYDINTSKLAQASRTRGSFELAISYQKYLTKDNTSKEAVRCPRF